MSKIESLRRSLVGRRHRFRRSWAPSLLRRIVRHRILAVGVAVVLVVASTAGIERRWDAAAAARDAWGASMQVWVVDDDVAAGDLVASSLRRVDRPVAVVPDGAVRELRPGVRAAVDLVTGEIVLAARLVGASEDVRPAGTLAVTVQVDGAAPHVASGDLVDLWAHEPRTDRATSVVHAVVVLDRHDDQLTIAVRERDMARIAAVAGAALIVARR